MIYIDGMKGLGDNIYQRAFVRQFDQCFLTTPWPEIYSDLPNVLPVRSPTTLRTQAKNVQRYDGQWYNPPARRAKPIAYGGHGIIPGMSRAFGIKPGVFDLPDYGLPPIAGPYAIVRPATLRREWIAASRNPDPAYIVEAATMMREAGLTVVSVADLQDGQEWIVGEAPPCDIQLHNGELSVTELLSLTRHATAVVGGIGWIVPACIAMQVPAWIICGGQGGYNYPGRITDPIMDLSRMAFAMPDNFCMCTARDHKCDKRIIGHGERFGRWLSNLHS